MQFIFKSVNSEMRKIGGRKLLLFSLFFIIIKLLCISYFIFNKNNPDMFQSTNLIAITVNFNTLTLSIFLLVCGILSFLLKINMVLGLLFIQNPFQNLSY